MTPLIDAIEVIVERIARTSVVAAKGVIKSEAAPKPMKSAVETSAKESAGEINLVPRKTPPRSPPNPPAPESTIEPTPTGSVTESALCRHRLRAPQ